MKTKKNSKFYEKIKMIQNHVKNKNGYKLFSRWNLDSFLPKEVWQDKDNYIGISIK